MKKIPYSIAILGAGIGREHVQGLAPLTRQFKVHTICDQNEARAAELAATCGAKVATQIDAVLADPEVDVVDVCLPPSLHVPVTLNALAAGKHVVCEKPMSGSLADFDRVEAAAKAAGKQVFPVFQYRYGPATRIIDGLMRAELLGPLKVATLETHWDRDAAYYTVPWRGTLSYEMGGAVLSHAIHIHDLIARLGGPITQVSATTSTAINPIETEDCAAIWMRTQSGALITSSITLGAAGNATRLRLVFEKATVESGSAPYRPAAEAWTVTPRNPEMAKAIEEATHSVLLKPGPHYAGFTGYFADLAAALSGRRTGLSLAAGRSSIELATAIYQSAATGAAVALPIPADTSYYTGWTKPSAYAMA